TTRLIGRRCTHSNVFSRPVLIARGLDGYSYPILVSSGDHVLRGLGGRFRLSCAVLKARQRLVSQPFGGYCERETPLPIPNREVKPLSADGTWPERAWESRSPPFYLVRKGRPRGRPFVVLVRLDGGAVVRSRPATKRCGARRAE